MQGRYKKGWGCICYIFILSLFCIRRSVSKSQDVSVMFLDLQNLQSVSWHLEFRKVFCRTFDGWFQWLCTFSGKHGVYQHIQLYFIISNQSYWLSWSLGRLPIPKYWHYSNSYPTHPTTYIGLIKKTQTQSISHYRFDHEQLFAWWGYELCGAPNNSSHVAKKGELFIKRPPERKVQLLSKYTNLNLQYSLRFIIVRVCWTGQLMKEKFEGCASMQQRCAGQIMQFR